MATVYRRAEGGNWQAGYTDCDGSRRQRSTGVKQKKLAKDIAENWEREAAKHRQGLGSQTMQRLIEQAARPMAAHVDEWINSLASSGVSEKHRKRIRSHVERSLPMARITNITAEKIEAHAAAMADAESFPRTIQSHIRSAKQFTRWLHRSGRLAIDPLINVKPPNPQTRRSIQRRVLSVAEWRALRTYLASAPVVAGMTGPQRMTLYHAALITGLRATELASLATSNVMLDTDPPYLLAMRTSTKNRKLGRQYLTSDLASELSTIIAGRSGVVFCGMPDSDETADMIRGDLIGAHASQSDPSPGFLAELNAAGERIDFHALRHTCGAWLAMSAVHPKTIQAIMRHSTITLTMDTYGHLIPSSESDAIATIGRKLRD